MTDPTSADPSVPIEYDTGVSNGDVDWLFRGKSKKLTKKMNSQNPAAAAAAAGNVASGEAERKRSTDEQSGERKHSNGEGKEVASTPRTSSASGTKVPEVGNVEDKATDTTKLSKLDTGSSTQRKSSISQSTSISPFSSTPSGSLPKVGQQKQDQQQPEQQSQQQSQVPTTPTNTTSQAPPPGQEEKASSKLDIFKIGRSRSSSESSQTQPGRRRSSLGFIPSTPPASSNSISPKNTPSVPPIQESKESGQGLSRSGSSSKRSLFSSISSKFKGSNQSQSSSQSSTSSANPNASSSSTLVPEYSSFMEPSLTAFGPSKPQLNLLGVSGNHLPENQDLASLINKPPNGIPKRRNSSVSSSNSNKSSSHHHAHPQQASIPESKIPSQLQSHSELSGSPQSKYVGKLHDAHKRRDSSVSSSSSVPTKVVSNDYEAINFRRVTFAIDKLAFDPQQQIPSRRPKKGNVLIPEDLVAPPPRLSQGISLSDGKNPMPTTENKYSEKELNQAIEAQRRALLEAEKHAYEAHLAAKRIAHEVAQYKVKNSSTKEQSRLKSIEDEEEEAAERDAENDRINYSHHDIEIDKPIHVHENYFEDEITEDPNNELDDQDIINNLTLESIYTRCCHLREILPIPATLKQLKNKSKPLQVLKLLNPKPTLIDVLSFSDFIAITPINTVIFDNVTMTTEMLKHFLSSLVYNKCLEKLSLRNVAIDETGWKYLCQFLSRNGTIKKLDISQQRIKSDTPPSFVRSNMNWPNFIKAVVDRGGIEELVINGCKLSDSIFSELIEKAVKITTYRLGVAAIELNLYKAGVVANWIASPTSKCVGVDIAFNDLSGGLLRPFIESFNKGNNKLLFFSLNSTKLHDIDEFGELLRALTKVTTLRFLDLSSIPELFPGIISRLNKYLPMMKDLRRAHFDLNDLSPQSIGAIADILPKCRDLYHVSLLGNRQLNHGAAGTLYTAVKLSKTLFTLDLDYDLVSDELSQRIAFYLMRNLDKTMNNDATKLSLAGADDDEELMFDGSLLMETAEKLIAANDEEKKVDPKIQRLITNALIERTRAVRKDIHQTIDTLFSRRTQGTLTLEGKETLLRFCLLDNSLEKVVHMFEEHAKVYAGANGGSLALSPSPSIEADNPNTAVSSTGIETASASSRKPATSDREAAKELPTNSIAKVFNSIGNAINLTVPPHDTLHESSSETITAGPILSPHNTLNNQQGYFPDNNTFQPHQVVVDSSSDGKDVPIDYLTGRPVLMRSISQTSVHAKEQEEEEGELHKFGFYMQQRNAEDEKDKKSVRDIPTLTVLPSGSELRDAIITAKGIESVTDLIDNINNNRISLDRIINVPSAQEGNGGHSSQTGVPSSSNKQASPTNLHSPQNEKEATSSPKNDLEDNTSIDSMELHESQNGQVDDHSVNAVVDEVYEKLLNDAQRVRSNKQE